MLGNSITIFLYVHMSSLCFSSLKIPVCIQKIQHVSDDSGPAVGACFSSLRNSEICISEDSDDSGPVVGACFSSFSGSSLRKIEDSVHVSEDSDDSGPC